MIFSISGQSSFQETLCYQKPVVAIPVSGDQPINANEAQRLGIGISHPYGSMNEKELYEVILTLIRNNGSEEISSNYSSKSKNKLKYLFFRFSFQKIK